MRAAGFRALVAQLGELSEVRRPALLMALKRKLSVAEAVDRIEIRFKFVPCCGLCGSKVVGKWASQSGLARYRCKDCGRTFNALTGTPLAQLHRRDAWLAYAQALVDGVSLRKAAARCGIALDTAFRPRPSQASSKWLKPSSASRQGAPAARGARSSQAWGQSKIRPFSDDYALVLVVRDRHGATLDHALPDLEGATFKFILKPVVAPDALLVCDGRAAYGRFADQAGLLHIDLNESVDERTYGSYHIQNVNAYISRPKQWMMRFKGVATEHLASYLGRRRIIEREGDDFSPARCIVNALHQAPT